MVVAVAAGLAAGATSAATSTVAICATLGEDAPIQADLVGTGFFTTVDILNCASATPSLATLQGYDAVLAFPDSSYSNFSQLAQNLADYVDGGGHVVLAQWGFASCCGTWWGTVLDTGNYLPYTGTNVKNSGVSQSLVIDDSSSPLLAGVNSVSANSGGYSWAANVSLRAGATSVAHWSGGQSAVAFKGNVVALNLWPNNTLNSGDWIQLLANALGSTSVPSQGRAGFCSAPGNTTASGAAIPPGTFLDLGVSQPSSDPHFTGATPAYYYQGLGISCDVLSGYHKTGEMVGYNGSGDPGGYTYMAKN